MRAESDALRFGVFPLGIAAAPRSSFLSRARRLGGDDLPAALDHAALDTYPDDSPTPASDRPVRLCAGLG